MSLSGWISTSNDAFLPLWSRLSLTLICLSYHRVKANSSWSLTLVLLLMTMAAERWWFSPKRLLAHKLSSDGQNAKGLPAEIPSNKAAKLLVFLPRWTVLIWKDIIMSEIIRSQFAHLSSGCSPQKGCPNKSSSTRAQGMVGPSHCLRFWVYCQ